MKKKNTLLAIITVVFFSLSIILSIFNYAIKTGSDNAIIQKIILQSTEIKYNSNPNIENLYALCDNLQLSKKYEKIIKYYPELLESQELSNYLEYICGDVKAQNDCYDLFLINYLISKTMIDDFDAKLFVEDMRKHKSNEFYNRMYLYAILQFDKDTESLALFNSKLDMVLEYLTDDEKIVILTMQSNIYNELGESLLSDKKMDDAYFIQNQRQDKTEVGSVS